MQSKSRTRTLILLIIEAALFYFCGYAAILLRFGDQAPVVISDEHGGLKIFVAMMVVLGGFYLFDLYDSRMIHGRSVLILRILQSLGV
ncbi:MAG: hypothetical protein L0220_30780, partial [Acidobacteria bacterium]|nr:hypothetical protein [Acidobacteriota bacterium]